jgi:predicted ribosomally synthesized peptide with nif11-like leader
MAVDNALAFLAHLETRADLRARIAEFKGRNAIDALRRLAASEGFHFSEADYRAAVVALAEGELSDEALAETQREMGMLDEDTEA